MVEDVALTEQLCVTWVVESELLRNLLVEISDFLIVFKI